MSMGFQCMSIDAVGCGACMLQLISKARKEVKEQEKESSKMPKPVLREKKEEKKEEDKEKN
jgi:hypothetical protein